MGGYGFIPNNGLEMYLLKSAGDVCRVKNEKVVGGKKNLGGK